MRLIWTFPEIEKKAEMKEVADDRGSYKLPAAYAIDGSQDG